MNVKIKIIENGKMPEFKTDGAVCADCYARCEDEIIVPPHSRKLVPLGFAIELPKGYEAQLRPRSGLTSKQIDNGFGTIDFDYRGEVKACLINNSYEKFVVNNGDRICQIAIREVPKISFEQVEELSVTERGTDGFGSTGTK